MKKKTFTST